MPITNDGGGHSGAYLWQVAMRARASCRSFVPELGRLDTYVRVADVRAVAERRASGGRVLISRRLCAALSTRSLRPLGAPIGIAQLDRAETPQ